MGTKVKRLFFKDVTVYPIPTTGRDIIVSVFNPSREVSRYTAVARPDEIGLLGMDGDSFDDEEFVTHWSDLPTPVQE